MEQVNKYAWKFYRSSSAYQTQTKWSRDVQIIFKNLINKILFDSFWFFLILFMFNEKLIFLCASRFLSKTKKEVRSHKYQNFYYYEYLYLIFFPYQVQKSDLCLICVWKGQSRLMQLHVDISYNNMNSNMDNKVMIIIIAKSQNTCWNMNELLKYEWKIRYGPTCMHLPMCVKMVRI